MNTQRIMRWTIVLFLFAALPGMTVTLAQGQEPPAKQLMPTTEVGESTTNIPWINNEHEPNNTIDDSEWGHGGDGVLGGTIGYDGDVDYWEIYYDAGPFLYERGRHAFLFNIDAQSFGSPVDTVICLYSDDGVQLACNDDMQDADSRDSLLYYNLEEADWYYLSVRDYYGEGGSDYRYELLISRPLLISAAAANLGTGTVAGIPFQSGDVLAWSQVGHLNGAWITYEKWVMLLDLSDLGVTGNITNLSAGAADSDHLLVSFAANVSLPGLTGKVNPWEVVSFDPLQIGPNTHGTFQRWWAGKSHGLTTTAEKIDAIEGGTADFMHVSTTGTASVTGNSGKTLKLADEDVGRWGADGIWWRVFDGAGWWEIPADEGGGSLFVNFGLGSKDVIAYSYAPYGDIDLTYDGWIFNVVLQGEGTFVTRMSNPEENEYVINYTQKDILWMDVDNNYSATVGVAWHGPDHGWNYNIDAIDYPGSGW